MIDFTTFIPFDMTKADEEKRMVWGYASTPAMDLQGEVVPLEVIKAALPGYMQWANIREMHTSSAVGVTKEANVDDKGLYIGAKIVDDGAWQKCKEGVYKGFSIGGQKLQKIGSEIKKLNLLEISVVDRPANPECKIDAVKCIEGAVPLVGEESANFASMFEKYVEMGKSLMGFFKGDGFSAPAVVRGGTNDPGTTSGNVPQELSWDDGFDKTVFTQEQRKHLAGTGAALPDGSYPIRNKEDLEHAIEAYGRSKPADRDKVKAHIKSRAKDLGAESALPEKWEDGNGSEKSEKADNMNLDILKRYAESHKAALTKAAHHISKAEEEREKCMKSAEKCMEKVKKAAGGEDKDTAEELSHLKKSLEKMGDHHDMVEASVHKAAASYGSVEGQPNGTVADSKREGLTVIPGAGGEAVSPGTNIFAEGSPYSAAALASTLEKAAKDAAEAAVKPLQEALQKSEIERAKMEGELNILKSMPAQGGTRPRLFSVDKGMLLPAGMTQGDEKAEVNMEIAKAAASVDPNDPDSATRAAARIIGLRSMNPTMFGKSITSPDFKGAAAGR